MRYSRQRELVMRQVQSRCDHPTADEIYTAVRDDCPGLSLGTVYRNLNGLVEAGRVRRVSIPGQADRFDRTLAEHDHMFCTRCGRVEDVQLDKTPLDAMIAGRPELARGGYPPSVWGVSAACRGPAVSGPHKNPGGSPGREQRVFSLHWRALIFRQWPRSRTARLWEDPSQPRSCGRAGR